MAALDPDNYIKLFRLDASQDSTYPENVVIIPAGQNIFQSMFHSENRGADQATAMDTNNDYTFSEECVNLLLKFRHELEELFQDCGDILGIAAVLWEDISRRLFERGFMVTSKQCATKWEALHSEYLEVAQSDDEGRVSGLRHFAAFEYLYKVRSKYIDSKILEDITEYLNSRSDGSSIGIKASADAVVKTDEKNEDRGTQPSMNDLSKREFSTLSNEEDSQMLIEAIDAAEKILEENLKESDETSEGSKQNAGDIRDKIYLAENSCWRYNKGKKLRVKCPGGEGESSLFLEQNRNDAFSRDNNISKTIHRHSAVEKEKKGTLGYQVFVRSEKSDLFWDTDTTQCFLDLRLYVETSQEMKQSILKKYKSIVSFVSEKMLLNGYQVSNMDCRKKWNQLLRHYYKDVKGAKRRGLDQNRLQGVGKYFCQIDKVLKKSALERSADDAGNFFWDQNSVRKLISIRIPMEKAFAMFKRYVILWQYVASQMEKYEFLPTYNECSIKWMELCEIYQICLDSVKRGAKEENIHWNFYQDMLQGFEQNVKSTEAVINYKCSTRLSTEDQAVVETELKKKSTQSLVPSTSFSGSETLAEIKLDTMSRIEDSDNGKKTNPRNQETEASSNTLEISVQQCSFLENTISEAELNVTKVPDSPQIDNNEKIPTLRELNSSGTENNSIVQPEKPKTVSNKMPGAPSLHSGNVFGINKQFEQTCTNVRGASKVTSQKMAATTYNESAIVDAKQGSVAVWTEEATILMMKFKISRELKFRSPLCNEVDLWNEIATDMQSAGHNVCHKSCATRWYQLMAAYKDNSSPENVEMICAEYRKQLKIAELPLARNTNRVKAAITKGNTNDTDYKAAKFVWTDEAIRKLLRLKFSAEIRCLKLYGSPLANAMQAAGFATIAPADVTKKWSRIHRMYKKSLFYKEIGRTVKWQYFELVDNYMNGLTSGENSEPQNEGPGFLWTHDAIQKLIDIKLLLENSHSTSDCEALSLLWRRVADAMVAEGFHVTGTECAIEWNFLISVYIKTEKELCSGNGAVIGNYFIMMNKALNKSEKSNNILEDMEEQPIDFSITRKKRKLEDDNIDNPVKIGRGSSMMGFEKNMSGTRSKKVSVSKENNKCIEAIGENMVNLSPKVIVPPSNCSPVDSSSEIKQLSENNVSVNSSANSSHVSGLNKEKEGLSSLRSELNKSQEEINVSIPKKNYDCDDEVLENEDYSDSSKENMACLGKETRNKTLSITSIISKREDIQSRILRNQKPCNDQANNNLQSQYPVINLNISAPWTKNTLIQDRAVNSTENIVEREETNRQWSEVATNLLIDFKIQYNQESQWDKVRNQLARLGYNYTHTECKQKWYSLKTTYEQKLVDIQAKRTIRTWPYFGKMDVFYKRLGNLYHGFRYILPKKRGHHDETEDVISPKKLAVSIKPSKSHAIPSLVTCISGNMAKTIKIIVDQEITIE